MYFTFENAVIIYVFFLSVHFQRKPRRRLVCPQGALRQKLSDLRTSLGDRNKSRLNDVVNPTYTLSGRIEMSWQLGSSTSAHRALAYHCVRAGGRQVVVAIYALYWPRRGGHAAGRGWAVRTIR